MAGNKMAGLIWRFLEKSAIFIPAVINTAVINTAIIIPCKVDHPDGSLAAEVKIVSLHSECIKIKKLKWYMYYQYHNQKTVITGIAIYK